LTPLYSEGLNEVRIKFEFYKRSSNLEKKNEFNIPSCGVLCVMICTYMI